MGCREPFNNPAKHSTLLRHGLRKQALRCLLGPGIKCPSKILQSLKQSTEITTAGGLTLMGCRQLSRIPAEHKKVQPQGRLTAASLILPMLSSLHPFAAHSRAGLLTRSDS